MKVIAYLHTLHMEYGQIDRKLTFTIANPFGEAGRDYSKEYNLTSEVLVLYSDCLPITHTIIEQSQMLDGRVSQTVQTASGDEYQRIVHADEAYPS